jgi:predicted membrane metal-binding protein
MVSHFYFRPIAALLISLMGGIVLGYRFPGHTIGTLAIGFIGAGVIGINLIRKKTAGLSPLLLYAALGYAAVQPWVAPHFSANHIQHFSNEIRWQITGVVDSHPDEFSYLKKFVLRADTLKHKKANYRVTGRIRVTVSGLGPVFARGDRVVFRSRLRQPRNFNNPGGFNYSRYMAFKGLWRTAYTKGSRLQVVHRESSADLTSQLSDVRRAMAALIERAAAWAMFWRFRDFILESLQPWHFSFFINYCVLCDPCCGGPGRARGRPSFHWSRSASMVWCPECRLQPSGR